MRAGSLPEQEGLEGSKTFKIVNNYNITLLDPTKPMEYNRERVEVRDGETTVSAVLHRPLRGEPWSFGYAGVCPLALVDTQGRCVQRQLELLTQEQSLEKDTKSLPSSTARSTTAIRT